MAASKGNTGKGAVLTVSSGGGAPTWTAVAQLKTLQFAGQKINFDDITNMDSPALGTSLIPLKESIPGTADPGTVALAGIFLPSDAGYGMLEAAYLTQAQTDFKIQLPKGPNQTVAGNLYAFSGYVVDQPNPDVQFDKTLTWKTTIQLNTGITVTLGS